MKRVKTLKAGFLFSVLISALSSCAYTAKTAIHMLDDSMKDVYDIIIVPGLPFDTVSWNRAMKGRIYWSKYLYDKGITKNVIYSGSAVYTPYCEAEIMALYAAEIGIPAANIYTETQAEHSTENVFYSYRKARQLGFGRIALASDPGQTKMLQRYTRKIVNPDIGLIPMVMDSMKALEPFMSNPDIDFRKAFVKDFVPLPERESFRQRFRGTRGLNVDTSAYR